MAASVPSKMPGRHVRQSTARVRSRWAGFPAHPCPPSRYFMPAHQHETVHSPDAERMPVELEQGRVVVYLVRHGQSRWNEAQKRRDVVGLVRGVDHQLTGIGVRQARALSSHLCDLATSGSVAPSSSSDTDDLGDILGADAVWSSPLSRALQTALLGMTPVLMRQKPTASPALPPLVLKPVLREKKNLGGLDTIGSCRGHACVDRALRLFGRSITQAEQAGMRRVEVDSTEAEHRWWSSGVETRSAVRRRIRQLLAEIQGSPHQSIVLVGHSHYFRELFRLCLNAGCVPDEQAEGLRRKKIGNCDVARCELDFSLDAERVISRVTVFTPAAGIARPTQRARRRMGTAKVAPIG